MCGSVRDALRVYEREACTSTSILLRKCSQVNFTLAHPNPLLVPYTSLNAPQ